MKKIVTIMITAILMMMMAVSVVPGYAESNDIKAAEETITEEMDFLFIESSQITTPGTQNIAVSWDGELTEVIDMRLIYENADGEQFEIAEKERTDKTILFSKDFAAGEEDVYFVKGVRYSLAEEELYFAFDDADIEASFEVVTAPESGMEDNIAVIDTDDSAAGLEEQLEDALEDANMPAEHSENGNIVVVLDPGHGGNDPGACYFGVTEASLTAKIAAYCKEELETYVGVEVYYSHGGEGYPGNSREEILGRVNAAAEKNADILVSLHLNATTGHTASGAEVYTPSTNYDRDGIHKEGYGVSENIMDELTALGLYDRGVKIKICTDNTKYPDGTLTDYYGIIRESKKAGFPGIIVEHAFIDNAADFNLLKTEEGLKKLGVADATGIAKYYGLLKGKWEKADGKWMSSYSDGTYAKDKWILYKKEWYYLDADGIMVTGLQKVNGKKYYFISSGAMQTGWQQVEGIWYYFNKEGDAKTGWYKPGKVWYYLNEEGEMAEGLATVNGKKYYFAPGGAMQTGWQQVESTWYYFNKAGDAKIGWYKPGKAWYYLNEEGEMAEGLATVNGKKYYFAPGGAMQTGWQQVEGTWYCFNKAGDAKTGWYKPGKVWYYLNEEGEMAVGLQTVKDKKYYFTPGGAMQTGWQKISGKWYYFNASGAAHKGWLQLGSKWYYLNEDYIMVTGTVKIGTKTYSFSSSGEWVQGYSISGKSQTTVAQMVRYYKASGRTYPASTYSSKGAPTLEEFCKIYFEEAEAEGIKAEVAFCQAMKETGWLKFGGDVKASQCNFAGIGAVGGGAAGHTFKDVREGARGHVQHLKAYANKDALVNTCVDPRFNLVTRGVAPYVEWLGQKANPSGKGWAPAATYGTDIVAMIEVLLSK